MVIVTRMPVRASASAAPGVTWVRRQRQVALDPIGLPSAARRGQQHISVHLPPSCRPVLKTNHPHQEAETIISSCLITRISQDLRVRRPTTLLKPTARGTYAAVLAQATKV
jgi:hypothetical protein